MGNEIYTRIGRQMTKFPVNSRDICGKIINIFAFICAIKEISNGKSSFHLDKFVLKFNLHKKRMVFHSMVS